MVVAIQVALLILAVAWQSAPAVPPASSIASPTGESEKLSKARALADLLAPADLMIWSNIKGWEAGVLSALRLAPGTSKLEESYPGITKAGIDAARPVGRRYCEEYVRKAAAHRAQLIAEQLTAAEIDVALLQYRKPAWRRFVAGLTSNVDFSAMAQDAAKSVAETGRPSIKQEDVNKTLMDAARESGGELAADDQLEIMRLMQTETAKKLAGIAAETDRKVLDWANNPDPVVIQEQNKLMLGGMLAYADARRK